MLNRLLRDKLDRRGKDQLEGSLAIVCTGQPTAHALARYRCFLPDLAGLAGLRRVGPGTDRFYHSQQSGRMNKGPSILDGPSARNHAAKSSEIEAVEVHHFGPRGHECLDESLLGIAACIDFGESAELGVRTKNQI